MLIGIPKELKDHEYRVGATPNMCAALVQAGHEVWVQTEAGEAIGYSDEMYELAGAKIVGSIEKAYEAEMIIKVKEPQEREFGLMHKGQILFCYLHLAPDPEQTKALVDKGVVAIAYETVTDLYSPRLPLLVPMSEVAGRIAVQAGAHSLQMANGGRGTLLGGVPGVNPGRVVILGGGVVGTHAAKMAMGLGAKVSILDNNLWRLRDLDDLFQSRVRTIYSSKPEIERAISTADLVIGAVLIPGKTAPRLIDKSMLSLVPKGSVVVDVAIDQGGCIETARPTTHSNPTYIVDGIVHYCVSNMPGACARTSTQALTNATLEYALLLANKGYKAALSEHSGLKEGLNVCLGRVTNKHVADDLGYEYQAIEEALRM
ncbi:MAG: alanine dehydrogenase [Chlamydiales bacterium]|nr:alanine dehydrogenase [Chlamydiales bacterium]